MSTTFCTWSVVLVETNSNPACLGEEVDLMELDEIKSNPAWQEIEVDNLMGLDEAIKNQFILFSTSHELLLLMSDLLKKVGSFIS